MGVHRRDRSWGKGEKIEGRMERKGVKRTGERRRREEAEDC